MTSMGMPVENIKTREVLFIAGIILIDHFHLRKQFISSGFKEQY